MKKLNYRHFICIGILLLSAALSGLLYLPSLSRLVSSFQDFGTSVAVYFLTMFGVENTVSTTVNNIPDVNFSAVLPFDYEEFLLRLDNFFPTFFRAENLSAYGMALLNLLYNFLFYFVMFGVPVLIVGIILWDGMLQKPNTVPNRDTRPLVKYKQLRRHVLFPAWKWVFDFRVWCSEHKYYKKLFFLVWALNLNIVTILTEALAYYFYFAAVFDFLNIHIQLYKCFIDLVIMFSGLPLVAWLLIGAAVLDVIRRKIGYDRLNRFEAADRAFIESLPVVSMICGTMNKGKTALLTDMGLSASCMFREKALELLRDHSLKFPDFPFMVFEREISRAVKYHQIYSLATCEKWLAKKQARFGTNPMSEKLWDYDFERYPVEYNDDLKLYGLFDVLESYCKLYYIYTMQTSFLLSNYAVREDVVLVDGGYFPAFSDDFFRREVKQQEQSLYSHIMDFDVLRLGKRIQKDNPRAGSFEYGVVLITEVGKERGNNLELRDVKKKDDAANQRNDGLNKWLKMARHSATVDYYPFIKVLTDEQRPESWGADCRDLCEIVRIEETGEQQLAMPFFTLASIFRDIVRHSYDKAASQFRFFRGDNTLFMTLFGSFAAAVERYYVRAVNRFGFRIMTLSTEAGTQDGQRKKIRYFQMRKKVFSDRYSTDCFSDYFREMSARALVGFGDYSSYRSSRASFEELRKQHSYFVNDILEKAETNAGEGFDKRQ